MITITIPEPKFPYVFFSRTNNEIWISDRTALDNALKEKYSEQYKQGFVFQTNTGRETRKRIAADYRMQGLEVFVGKGSFDMRGQPYENGFAIFTRKKQESK